MRNRRWHSVSIKGPGIRGLDGLKAHLQSSKQRLIDGLWELMRETRDRWVQAAKDRVPVETGVLHDSIEGAVELEVEKIFYVIVGSNVEWASWTEFGTTRIAGGRVLALGEGAEITDAMAVKDWPAKEARGSTHDQMPWLRPAWWSIEEWFREQLQLVVMNALSPTQDA